jgi:protein disulfide-isomerase
MLRVIFLTAIFVLANWLPVCAEETPLVSAENAAKIREDLAAKIMQTMLVYQQNNKPVSLALRTGVFVRGRVVKVDKKGCHIVDYQKKIQVVDYAQIKARYLATLMLESGKEAKVLYDLGQLLCHEGETEWALKYLRPAAQQGISEADILLKKIEAQKRLADENKQMENERAKAELEKKVAEDKQKTEAAKTPTFQWYTNFAQAQQLAQQQQKQLFVDFTGSDWCGWCIKLDEEVFSTEDFRAYAAARFICVKLDFPKRKELPAEEKQQNEQLAQKYQVRGFPTVLILQHNGEVAAKTGYVRGGAAKFIDDLNQKLK